MNPYKYTIIFMRDDSSVRRMRAHPLLLWTLGYLLLGTLLTACLGGYFGFHFWQENTVLTKKIEDFQKTEQHKDTELERLHTLEKLITHDDQENMDALRASAQVEKHAFSENPGINLFEILEIVDRNIFSVATVQAHFRRQGLQLAFDVNSRNTRGTEPLKGRVEVHLITGVGTVIPLEMKKDLLFTLRRMKQFRLEMDIPGTVSVKDIFGIRISVLIEPSDELVFSETYPLSHIRL